MPYLFRNKSPRRNVDQYYDEVIELPDFNHITLKSYLETCPQGLTTKKLDLIQSMIYVVSELHKLGIALWRFEYVQHLG